MTEHARVDRWETRAEWPLAAIALVFLAAYTIEVLVEPRGHEALALRLVTNLCWAVFAVDYAVRLWLADNRTRWFLRHLVDLAVVVLPLLRPLRLLRLVILVSALQRAIGDAIRGRVILYAASGAVLLVYVSSLAVLQAERADPDASITTFGNALWWSVTTITTVGYGDEFPVTTTGRVIAVLLMIGGISLLGTITATLASWLVQRVAEEDTTSQAITAAHIEELRDEIHALREQLGRPAGETVGPEK